MHIHPISLFAVAVFFNKSIECAKILAIFPSCGRSQYSAAEPFLKALAARGHNLTVVSQHPQKTKFPNFKDITLVYNGYDDMVASYMDMDKSTLMNIFFEHANNITLLVLENPEIQEILNSKSTQFDLVILETKFDEALYAFGPHFNAHLIGFSSYGTDDNIDELVGNTSPISYVPQTFSAFGDNMTFWQRLQNIKISINFWFNNQFKNLPWQRRVYKKYFPHLKLDLEDIRRNFSLILLNQHFSLSFARPYVPNMIDVGGLFIKDKPSTLPHDMMDFLDNAKDGAIYFSLGSNVKSEFLPPEKLQILLNVLGSLKQRVMFKFERSELPNKPSNVFISEWFPQSDILAHPNVKLFITHGGLLSTTEAIYYAKPIIAFPVFFDQFLNAARAESAGFGITVSFENLSEELFKRAILNVLENDSFKRNVEMRSRFFHDQPMKPIDKAIFWTEYVLRHNGANHMRVAAQRLNFWQYNSLDTVGFLFGVLCLGVFFLVCIFYYIFKCFCYKTSSKLRKNKND